MTRPHRPRRSWRMLRLGTRLALALGVLALVVFAVVGTVMVGIMRDYLSDRLDTQLAGSQIAQIAQLRDSDDPPRPPWQWYSALFEVRDGKAILKSANSPPGTIGALGRVAEEAGGTEVLRTVPISDGGSYRVRVCPVGNDVILVSAAPLSDLDRTVNQLILVEVIAFVVALTVLVIVGRMVLRRGLRPLSDMAGTAHDITSHDLTDSADLPVRAGGNGGGPEIEELRTAFNLMLEHIDLSLNNRAAAEQRLRRFVADASHELRTPLTSIRGYAELFSYAAANEPAERDAHLAKIRTETARMSLLVDDLLLLARLDEADAETPLRLTDTDIVELVAAAAHAFGVAHPEHPVGLATSDPVVARVDPLRLRQVVDNLLANVAAHTPAGTSVRLSVTATPEGAVLRVADDGPGVPAEHQARIFDRFYRVDDSRNRSNGGSGLGLAVVRSLVTAHGGTVELSSVPGHTSFTVRLPADPH